MECFALTALVPGPIEWNPGTALFVGGLLTAFVPAIFAGRRLVAEAVELAKSGASAEPGPTPNFSRTPA